ncbi:hypothetical protein O3M35_008787 [Rhynocoris fuscipes]
MNNPVGQRGKSVSTYKYNTIETSSTSGSGDMKMKQNISELDSLLDDLNTAQKKNFSESKTITTRNVSGIDPGYLDQNASHSLVKGEQKYYTEDRGLRGRSGSARRELVFTGQRSQDPSPSREQLFYEQHEQTPKVQQFYRYEKTTSTRTTAPGVNDIPPLVGEPTSNTVKNYTYTDESPLPIRHRSPSPGGGIHSSYHYSSTSTSRDPGSPQSPISDKYRTLPDDYPPRPGGPTSYSYSSSTVRESRSDTRGKTPPPPHRSPSPVSFSQPPPPARSTTVKTYTYDQQLTNSGSHHRSPSPGVPKFSPSDPSHNRLTYNVSPAPPPPTAHTTVTNYKYSTTHHQQYQQQPDDTVPLMPRPFPTPQPSPTPPHSDQQPPKKLDELMASFSDADQRHNRYTETTVHHHHHYTNSNSTPQPNPTPQAIILHPSNPSNENERLIEKEKEIIREKEKEKEKLISHEESKNVTGPPVYYPPGVELFARKEESMMERQSGEARYRAKAKYEYEAKSKSKMSESSGKAVVPVCLPLCCAMPCVIM